VLAYGSANANAEEGKQQEPLPPGETKTFDFFKSEGVNSFPGYAVGFFGEYDENHITYLGAYVAPVTEINYYSRRAYILAYKKLQQDSNLVDDIAKTLEVVKEGDRFKDANLEGKKNNSSKILFYFLDSSLNHPELFKAVLEYL